MNTRIPVGTIVIFGFFLLVMALTYVLTRPPERPPELEGVLRHDFKLLYPFKLTDQNNRVFDEKSLRGKWTFVFFGYTSCPDVCPTTLYALSEVHGLLTDETGKPPEDMQVVFVSVDPDRDTTEKLARYVSYFNSDFIGATADREEIDRLTRQFGAGYVLEKNSAGDKSGQDEYSVSHTRAIFLVDPYGRLVATFSQPHRAATIVSLFKKIRAYFFPA